jgi:hypothetical protein
MNIIFLNQVNSSFLVCIFIIYFLLPKRIIFYCGLKIARNEATHKDYTCDHCWKKRMDAELLTCGQSTFIIYFA